MQLFAADLPTSENGAPLCPIIGVRLSQDRSSDPEVKDTGAYLGSMFDTARNLLDREFLFKNPAYANWVGVSATGLATQRCHHRNRFLPLWLMQYLCRREDSLSSCCCCCHWHELNACRQHHVVVHGRQCWS